MATHTIYILGTAAVSPNWFGNTQLDGTAPTQANTVYGWTPGTTSLATPYWRGRLGTSAGRASVSSAASWNASTSAPTAGTGASSSTAGDSFVAGPFTGTFAATAWTFNWNMRALTAGCIGHVNMRVWKSANASGSGATQLLANTAGATITPSTTADTNSQITWNPSALTFTNEYLFFQVEWQETTVGSPSNASVVFSLGGSAIVTPNLATGTAYTLPAGTGAFAVNGFTVGLGTARTLLAGTGAFAVNGFTINPVWHVIVPERWDIGRWDEAHWDGQLGLRATPGAIVLTGNAAGLVAAHDTVLTATPGAIVLTGNDAVLSTTAAVNWVLPAAPGAIVLTGSDAGLIYTPAGAIDLVLSAAPGAIVLAGVAAGLYLTRAPFVMPPPGRLEFGVPAYVPRRW